MIIRKLLFTALRMAAQNPSVRRQAVKAADKAVEAARPSLLKPRRAGEAVRSASDELKEGVKKFKAGMEGEEILPPVTLLQNRQNDRKKYHAQKIAFCPDKSGGIPALLLDAFFRVIPWI